VEAGVLVPPYRRIADHLRARIEAGELLPGDRVPSSRAITRDWGVAIATATKALAVLRDDGLTVPRPGVGTVVAQTKVRRKERDLTRDRVVRAAIAVADAHGMAELSMRRVAAELGVSTMSLYRHVPGKAELVLAMIDTAIGEQPMPARRPAGWRARLELCARLEWAVFRRHPWLAPSMSLTRPDLSPNAARISEWVLAALADTGLDPSSRMYVNILLFSFVRGVASALEPEAEAVRETGLSNDEWLDTQEAAFTSMIDELPHFQQFATEPFDFDLTKLFEFGLARLLDGVALFIAAQAPRSMPGR
jgi:AcrR family transcriptional regulator